MNLEKVIRNLFKKSGHEQNKQFFGLKNKDKDTIRPNTSSYDLAKCHMRVGNYIEALLYLNKELEITPNSSDALWGAAKCSEELEDYDLAISLYQDSLKNKIDDNIFEHMFSCYAKMYALDANQPNNTSLVLQKVWYSLNDRILRGETSLEPVINYLEKNFMKSKFWPTKNNKF